MQAKGFQVEEQQVQRLCSRICLVYLRKSKEDSVAEVMCTRGTVVDEIGSKS